MSVNLLTETLDVLKEHGKTIHDITWFGTDGFCAPLENFVEIMNVNYDNGYGGQQIACDLIICGENWWLERAEYDGAEWWEFKQMPQKPDKNNDIHTVKGGSWQSLLDINRDKEPWEC